MILQEIKIDVIPVYPLGLMCFLNIIFSFAIGKDKSTNQFIIGVFLMYLSWLIVYLVFILPAFKKLKGKNEQKKRR